MSSALYLVLEREIPEFDVSAVGGKALAQAVYGWNFPLLRRLQDFFSVNQDDVIALLPDDAETIDAETISLLAEEWFSPAEGLQAVRQVLSFLRTYAMQERLRHQFVADLEAQFLAELETVEAALLLAQKHDIRFHFALDI